MRRLLTTALITLLASACGAQDSTALANGGAAAQAPQPADRPFASEVIAQFEQPWAMAFLPGTNQALITEQKGRLLLWSPGAEARAVAGVPEVAYGGQGGLGDVVAHPDFANNRLVYLSWAEAGAGGRGAVVGRARLASDGAPRLEGLQIIWRQDPKVSGSGHYAHRIAFAPDGHLFISSGDRQQFTPAQDMSANLGKVMRFTDAGGIPSDNPFYDQGGPVRASIWSLGHRNPLGLAFAPDGRLWSHEMGPKGGDEFNRIERGANYGYPIVSDGDHYDGRDIPDHATRPEFNAPEAVWTPVISPSSMIFYSGSMFPAWRGSALIGALSGKGLVRVAIDGDSAREIERFDMGARIREVEQAPDGSIYVLEDEDEGSGGRLLRLTPTRQAR